VKKKILIIVSVSVAIIALFISLTEYGKFVLRITILNFPDTNDYKKYPAKTIAHAENYFSFSKGEKLSIDTEVTYTFSSENTTKNLIKLLEDTETTSLIVIKDDKIVFEEYYHGYRRSTPHILYSVSKTIVSALIGIAVNDRFISSIDEPIEKYVHELIGKEEGKVTIKQLLTMASGYNYNHGDMPWTDDCKITFTSDLRKTTFKNVKKEEEPGVYNHYNDYNYILLGMILERATGMSVSEYFEMKIWKKIQAEYDALWTLDSKKHEFERLTMGLAACPIDLAKFGRLYLNNGNWEGERVIPEKWVYDSTRYEEEFRDHGDYYLKYTWIEAIPWLKKGGYYKYAWWGYSEDGLDYSYTAEGFLGQVLYVSPKNNLIIVRTGKKWGDLDWWIDLVHLIAESLYMTQQEHE
jgi:CubicO group peptidase (beta-lactamase class C family)